MLMKSQRRWLWQLSVPLLALPLTVGGCATRSDGSMVTLIDDVRVMSMSDSGLTEDEARELERVQRYARMRSQGSVGGALVGTVTGMFVASDNPGVGAAVGAVGGAALGYLAGAYVANLNAQAEDRRETLNGQVAAAEQAVAETQRAVATSRKTASNERARVSRLNREYRAGEITQDQYREQISELDKRLIIVDESLRAAEDDVSAIERSVEQQNEQGVNASTLEAQKQRMEREVAALKQERDVLIEVIGSIPPEIGGPTV